MKDINETKQGKFIQFLIEKIKTDNGLRAAFTRADNESTQFQVWDTLQAWSGLENESEVSCYATVGAAIARDRIDHNGHASLGEGLRLAFDHGSESDPAKARLRRILACENRGELCQVVRSVLRLIHSKGVTLNYKQLLLDFVYFNEKIKMKWASDFYRRSEES